MVRRIQSPVLATAGGLLLSRGHLVQAIAEMTPQGRLFFSRLVCVLALVVSLAGIVIPMVQAISDGQFESQQGLLRIERVSLVSNA